MGHPRLTSEATTVAHPLKLSHSLSLRLSLNYDIVKQIIMYKKNSSVVYVIRLGAILYRMEECASEIVPFDSIFNMTLA